MLRDKFLALATRWARHAGKDSRGSLASGVLAANGLVLLVISTLPAISSPVLAMVGLYALGIAMGLFERPGFIGLMRDHGTVDSNSGAVPAQEDQPGDYAT